MNRRGMYSMEESLPNSEDRHCQPSEKDCGTTPDNKRDGLAGPATQRDRKTSLRNLVAFWLFGLCNNFAYVIMLSAAHDILTQEELGEESHTNNGSINSTLPTPITPGNMTNANVTYLQCNSIGTGAILLADILPTLIVKLTAPFYIDRISYRLKVAIVVVFSLGSFIIVGCAQVVWLSILGVVCASIGAGLGEPTFLGLSTFFDRNVVSTWSSGTGGAGLFGALSYAGLTSSGVSPRNTLFIMTVMPVILALSYCFLLSSPKSAGSSAGKAKNVDQNEEITDIKRVISWREKIHLIKPLLKFMIPLMVVYLAEYFINQGLHELLYFKGIWLTTKEQYRWFQVDYQLGVFISRSSVNLFRVNKLWILPVLQVLVVAVLQTQVLYRYINTIWVIFAIILFEGLLGGCAYVNTFYKMSIDIEAEYREYSLSVATVADSCGIALAGVVSIPVHNALCNLDIQI